jgi:hypothetical protein
MPAAGSLELTANSTTMDSSAEKTAVLVRGGTIEFMNSQTPTIG